MSTKKFKGFTYTEDAPKGGDTMVCINPKSADFGSTEIATYIHVKSKTIDTKNWKVITNIEERRQTIVDDVIEDIKQQIADGDLTVLDGLLKFIPEKVLIQSLSEDEWKQYYKIEKK